MDIREKFKKSKNIVVLNLIPYTIGDSLYLVSLLRVLRKNLPNARITLTGSPVTYELLKNEPSIDEFKVFSILEKIAQKTSLWKKIIAYARLLFQEYLFFRKEKFDSCIVALPLFWLSPLAPFLARIPIRIGYSFKGDYLKSLLHLHVRARGGTESGEKWRHFIYLYLDICDALGLQYAKDDTRIRFFPEKEGEKIAEEIMKKYRNRTCIAFQVGSKSWKKSWLEDRWIVLGKRILQEDKKVCIILVGSKSEFDMNEHIKKSLNNTRALNLCGESLSTIGAILKKCRIMIGNTSGLLHLASSVGTTTIGLYWVAVPSQSAPIGIGKTIPVFGNNICIYCKKNHVYDNEVFNNGCRHSISVDMVFNVVKKALRSKDL